MREIKFDAIYKPTGEHFNPISINFNDNTVVGNFDCQQGDWCHFSLDGKYGDVILRQFTGLKDKNGKEIYEGDICFIQIYGNFGEPSPEESFNVLVKWNNGFYLIDAEGDTWTEWITVYKGDDVEVIGNIYKNPELINS